MKSDLIKSLLVATVAATLGSVASALILREVQKRRLKNNTARIDTGA